MEKKKSKKKNVFFEIVLRSQRSGWFFHSDHFYVWCILSQSRGTLAPRYVYLRVPSSVQQPFATLGKYVFLSTCSFRLCHLYPTPSRSSYILNRFDFFRSSYSSGGDFFCVLSYSVRYQLICLLSFLSDAWFFSLSLTTEFVYLQDEESGRTLGVLLMLVKKNGLV